MNSVSDRCPADRFDCRVQLASEEILTIPVRLVLSIRFYLIVAFTVALFLLFLAILSVKKTTEAGQIYYWVSLIVAVILMTTWGRYTDQSEQDISYAAFCAAYSFTPALFIHLVLFFRVNANL
jgi:hypothetical protein